MIRIILSLLALFALPAAATPLTPAEIAKVDSIVAREMARTETPSVSIAIVRDGKIAFTKAYGKASEKLPATTDLPYQIASNSKQFTAMAMLMLEDEGKLKLDDPVAKYLPGITDGDKITLRQLLSHTSGLQDYWPQDYSFAAMAKPTTPAGIIDRWAKKPLDYEPGTKWQYSNTGFVIAGEIISKVSGMPLMRFFQTRIFKPLGMTSAMSQDDAIGARYPVGYGRAALGPVRAEPPPARGWLYAAAELAMTPADLAKWNIARVNRSLVPASDWQEQEKNVLLKDGTDTGYGLGVYHVQWNGHDLIRHTGEAVGFLSANWVFPDDKIAVVVATNTWSGNAFTAITGGIAKMLLNVKESEGDKTAAARVRALYDQLRSGTIDRSLLTDNANYYFTPQRIADFASSLGPLGAPIAIEPDGASALRGGLVTQGYVVKYANRTLNLSVFREPGDNGRIEQFLVSPGS